MIRRHFLTYLALSTMAIAQPVLDLYGRNITVFSAAKLSPIEVVLFLALVVIAPACLAIAVDRLSRLFGPKVNEATRLVLLAIFSGLLGLAVARWAYVENNLGASAMFAVFAFALPVAFDKFSGVREWSRWLAVLSVAVTANAFIQLQPVLLRNNGPTSDAVVNNKQVSVLQIVLDEFPLYALLDSDGSINRARFPGFAQLADESTWYRNSVAESNFTHQAVPAILSSRIPTKTGGPFLTQYPKNIFTLFANSVSVGGIEPVTSLCPHTVCGTADLSSHGFSFSRFKSFVTDASYVYGQRVAPPFVRSHIPSIDGTWGGFNAVASRFVDTFDVGALSQVEAIEKGTSAFVESNSQRVQVVHALLPHAPWHLTSDYRVTPLSSSISTVNPESEDGVRDTYQSFLHQVGAADTAIGNVIAQLKEAGRWDSTMLIVTADHGISFLPALPQRHTDFTVMDAVNDIYRIPTFIKYPKQQRGIVDDCPITNLDLLPTVIDTTNTSTKWSFAGKSVALECPKGRARTVVSATGETAEIAGGFADVVARANYYATIVPNEGPMVAVASVGKSAALIGKNISSSLVSQEVMSWTLNQKKLFTNISAKRGSAVPALITGTITLAKHVDVGTEGIVVIDGVAAGVIGELSGAHDVIGYTAILDYSGLTAGDHTVELYVKSPSGFMTLSRVGAPS